MQPVEEIVTKECNLILLQMYSKEVVRKCPQGKGKISQGPQPILYDLHKFHIYHGELSHEDACVLLRNEHNSLYLSAGLDTSLKGRGTLKVCYKKEDKPKSYRNFFTRTENEAKYPFSINVRPTWGNTGPSGGRVFSVSPIW